MKLEISRFRTTITFLITAVIAAGIMFGVGFQMFLTWPWDFKPYLIISLFLLGGIVLYICTIKFNYYILQKKYVTVKKYKKELVYYFSDIIYIDEEKSAKQKIIHFYTNKGHVRYLTFDKKGLLYKAMLEKCTNRLTKEEFIEKYPNVKL